MVKSRFSPIVVYYSRMTVPEQTAAAGQELVPESEICKHNNQSVNQDQESTD